MAETGHAKNVEHLAAMIEFVKGYGATYNPTNGDLSLAKLQTLLTQANTDVGNVSTIMGSYKVAVNDRENVFTGIRQLATRVVNAFAVSGAAENAIEDAKGFKRKLDGARAKALPKDDPGTPDDESKGGSVSQQSYTQLVQHLDDLIHLLTTDGHYNPNETPLKLVTLNALSTTLKTKNQAVLTATAPLSNARVARDTTLYGSPNGLCDRASLVKKYVKSLYGADSPQYKQISGLEFTRPGKK